MTNEEILAGMSVGESAFHKGFAKQIDYVMRSSVHEVMTSGTFVAIEQMKNTLREKILENLQKLIEGNYPGILSINIINENNIIPAILPNLDPMLFMPTNIDIDLDSYSVTLAPSYAHTKLHEGIAKERVLRSEFTKYFTLGDDNGSDKTLQSI